MQKTFLILAICIALFISACKPKLEKVVEKTYPNGKPEIEKYYAKEGDKKVLAKEIIYWPSEKKKIEGSYKNEQRDGKWTAWFENGNKWSEGSYVNGIDDGEKTVWYENGQIFYNGQFKMGNKVGVWKIYDETGKLVQEINYDKGQNQ